MGERHLVGDISKAATMTSLTENGPSSRSASGGDIAFSVAAIDGRPQVGVAEALLACNQSAVDWCNGVPIGQAFLLAFVLLVYRLCQMKVARSSQEQLLGNQEMMRSESGARAGESIVTKGMSSQPDGTPGTITAGPLTGGPHKGCCAVRLDGGQDLIINRKTLKTRVLV